MFLLALLTKGDLLRCKVQVHNSFSIVVLVTSTVVLAACGLD